MIPKVTLKLATSLDGRIATASGESKWITGEAAREQVHRLRAEHDAVLVGAETAIADDPELTVRLAGFSGRQPARVVLDTRQRLPARARLARTAREVPTYVLCAGPPETALEDAGVLVRPTPLEEGRVSPLGALQVLGGDGISSVMIEGGGETAASFLRAGLVDRIEWFRAAIMLGADGRPAVGGLMLDALAGAPRFKRIAVSEVGADLWERYERP